MSNHELPVRIKTRLEWIGFLWNLPVYVVLRHSFGRYTVGLGVGFWVVILGVLSILIDNTIVQWLSGGFRFSGLTSKFAMLVIGLTLFELLEIFSRSWAEDPILSGSPGETRTWFYDWILPENLTTQEAAARVVEPALTFVASIMVAPHDPFLGGYFFLATITTALLGNWLYMEERRTVKGLKDMRTIGENRIAFVNGAGIHSDGEIAVSGVVKLAFNPSDIQETLPKRVRLPDAYRLIALPRAYRSLATEYLELLDAKKLREIFGIKKSRVACPHCQRKFYVNVDQLGLRGRCVCRRTFSIREAA